MHSRFVCGTVSQRPLSSSVPKSGESFSAEEEIVHHSSRFVHFCLRMPPIKFILSSFPGMFLDVKTRMLQTAAFPFRFDEELGKERVRKIEKMLQIQKGNVNSFFDLLVSKSPLAAAVF